MSLMFKIIIAIIPLLFFGELYAQDTIIAKTNNLNYIQIDYQNNISLKDSLTDGYYIILDSNKNEVLTGYFYHGKKHGLHIIKLPGGSYENYTYYKEGMKIGLEIEKLKLNSKWLYNIENHFDSVYFQEPSPQVEW